jgi:hypothetical protein
VKRIPAHVPSRVGCAEQSEAHRLRKPRLVRFATLSSTLQIQSCEKRIASRESDVRLFDKHQKKLSDAKRAEFELSCRVTAKIRMNFRIELNCHLSAIPRLW